MRIALAARPEDGLNLGREWVIGELRHGFTPYVDRLRCVTVVPVHPAEIEPRRGVRRVNLDRRDDLGSAHDQGNQARSPS